MKRLRFLRLAVLLSSLSSIQCGCDSGSGEAGPPRLDTSPSKEVVDKGPVPDKTTEGTVGTGR
jgi:hypothetical protein